MFNDIRGAEPDHNLQVCLKYVDPLRQIFIHESIIGSLFNGRVESAARVGNHEAIVPSVEGWARITGYNTIFIDDRDPYARGFQLV